MTNTLKVLIYEQVLFLETHQQEKERRILGIYLYEVPARRGSPARLGLSTQNTSQQKLSFIHDTRKRLQCNFCLWKMTFDANVR